MAERPKRSGVIYAGSRDGIDTLKQKLVAAGVPALAYHAGLDKDVRAARLEQFLEAEAAVMVATTAFGMGVDKPDIRFVIEKRRLTAHSLQKALAGMENGAPSYFATCIERFWLATDIPVRLRPTSALRIRRVEHEKVRRYHQLSQ